MSEHIHAALAFGVVLVKSKTCVAWDQRCHSSNLNIFKNSISVRTLVCRKGITPYVSVSVSEI